MSIEAWTIIATGVALAALNLGLIAWLRSDMKHAHMRLEDRILAGAKKRPARSGCSRASGSPDAPTLTRDLPISRVRLPGRIHVRKLVPRPGFEPGT